MDPHQTETAIMVFAFPLVLGVALFALKWMLKHTEQTIDRLGAKMDSVGAKVDGIGQQVAGLSQGHNDLAGRVARIEDQMQRTALETAGRRPRGR